MSTNVGPWGPVQYRDNSWRDRAARIAFVVGGAIAALSSLLPWITVPLLGGVNLWDAASLMGRLSRLSESLGGVTSGGHAVLYSVLLPLGVLVLSLGSVTAAIARRPARVVPAVTGGLSLLVAIFGLVAAFDAAQQSDGAVAVGVGPWVLTVGSFVTLVGSFVVRPWSSQTAVVANQATLTWAAAAVAFLGVALLGVGIGGLAATGNQPTPTAAAPTFQASVPTESSPEPVVPSPVEVPQETATTSAVADPESVVTSYFDAITAGDYRRAFDLGGNNIDASYAHFAAGFADTVSDSWVTDSVDGDRVTGQLTATQTDGSTKAFSGYYVVSGGVITEGHLRSE